MAGDSPTDTPKKWWWLVAVAVPVAVAVIAIVPDMLPSGVGGGGDTFRVIGSQFNDEVTFNTFSVVVDQADQAGIKLSDGELETLRQALSLAQSRQFDAAIPLLESLEDVAAVPAVLNNLGAAYRATGDHEAARRYFQKALARDPTAQAAQINLGALDELAPQEESVSSPTAKHVTSNIPNVRVELIEFSRFENTITLKLRYINAGEEDQSRDLGWGSYLMDEITGKRFEKTATSSQGYQVIVSAGGSIDYWVKYTLPEGEMPKYLTAVLYHGVLLEHLAVPE